MNRSLEEYYDLETLMELLLLDVDENMTLEYLKNLIFINLFMKK